MKLLFHPFINKILKDAFFSPFTLSSTHKIDEVPHKYLHWQQCSQRMHKRLEHTCETHLLEVVFC